MENSYAARLEQLQAQHASAIEMIRESLRPNSRATRAYINALVKQACEIIEDIRRAEDDMLINELRRDLPYVYSNMMEIVRHNLKTHLKKTQ